MSPNGNFWRYTMKTIKKQPNSYELPNVAHSEVIWTGYDPHHSS